MSRIGELRAWKSALSRKLSNRFRATRYSVVSFSIESATCSRRATRRSRAARASASSFWTRASGKPAGLELRFELVQVLLVVRGGARRGREGVLVLVPLRVEGRLGELELLVREVDPRLERFELPRRDARSSPRCAASSLFASASSARSRFPSSPTALPRASSAPARAFRASILVKARWIRFHGRA